MGLSYAKVGELLGFAKSSLCRWIGSERLEGVRMSGDVLEMDGVWVRTQARKVELKVVRDDAGVALGSFGSWEDALNEAYDSGVEQSVRWI